MRLENENSELKSMIDKVWDTIWLSYDIEERRFFEEEAPKAGNWSPLQMALHYIWKRDPKTEKSEKVQRLVEALKEIKSTTCPSTPFYCHASEEMQTIARAALDEWEKGEKK